MRRFRHNCFRLVSTTFYAGVGFDVGVGGGWSVDVFHYRMDFERVLGHPGNNPDNINPRAMTQYQMRRTPKQ